MQLEKFLTRIGFVGTPKIDAATLIAMQRAYLTAVPYENLDIHLARSLSMATQTVYDKIVLHGRGGWCYEMNTLLAWALREIGFDVTLLSAAVGVTAPEQRVLADHMALLVTVRASPEAPNPGLDQAWLLDAGFGNAFLEPLLLREGEVSHGCHTFALQRDADFWVFKNHAYGGAGFDFTLEPRTPEHFYERCNWLQTAPDSGFVQVAVCHIFKPDYSIVSLRGALLTTVDCAGKQSVEVCTRDDYAVLLRDVFALRLSDTEIDALWHVVWPAHLAWRARLRESSASG